MTGINNYDELIKKVNKLKANGVDLSVEEDLSIAIMNLISLEEHFFFTAEKTGKPEYFDLLQEVRVMRGELMKKIIINPQGEEWCISKHLLATSMRLMEVGTKQHKLGKKDEAKEMFNKSYKLFSLFFGIRLKLTDAEVADVKNTVTNQDKTWTKEQIMTKLLDCCNE